MKTNVLYFGNNLNVLRERIPDESVDLIYTRVFAQQQKPCPLQ